MIPNISIIIINWNGWKDTVECLGSLYQIDYPNYNVIIVDNDSSDDSIEKIREYSRKIVNMGYKFLEYDFNGDKIVYNSKTELNTELVYKKKLILIKNDENYGFAQGNNIGIEYAFKNLNPDYILLLNNDTVVEKNFLTELIKAAEKDEKIGSAQSTLLKPEGDIIDSLGQEMLMWGAKDIGINSKYDSNIKEMEIFGSCAAASIYKRKTLERAGLFDKDFFIILEDVDMSWRIRLNGLKSILAPESVVYHKRGISEVMSVNEILFGEKTPEIIFKWYHSSKNWLIIIIRYYPISLIGKAVIKQPHKFFFTFLKCSYSSLKIGKFGEVTRILIKNFKIRKENKKNPLLNEIQSRWIK